MEIDNAKGQSELDEISSSLSSSSSLSLSSSSSSATMTTSLRQQPTAEDVDGRSSVIVSTSSSSSSSSADQAMKTLTIRLLVNAKEAGCIIGKNGNIVRRIREESGARVNISDGKSDDRIISVIGSLDRVYTVLCLISQRFLQNMNNNDKHHPYNHDDYSLATTTVVITVKLIVPTCQCGSLIGKSGRNIKKVRELTGACIQVDCQLLPASTDRLVTVSGTMNPLLFCLYEISSIFFQFPPKSTSVPYHPHQPNSCTLTPSVTSTSPAAETSSEDKQLHLSDEVEIWKKITERITDPNSASAAVPGQSVHFTGGSCGLVVDGCKQCPAAAAATAASNSTILLNSNPSDSPVLFANAYHDRAITKRIAGGGRSNVEVIVSNNSIGSLIGWRGAKINEIRHLSGAGIKISQPEVGNLNRTISISGALQNIQMAYHLMQLCVQTQSTTSLSTSSSSSYFQAFPSFPAFTAAPVYSALPLVRPHSLAGATYSHFITPIQLYGGSGVPPVDGSRTTLFPPFVGKTKDFAIVTALPSSKRNNCHRFFPY